MIHVGDFIKKPTECNKDFHGEWSIYQVKQQGIVPILTYVRSEKGDLLPEGYLASTLSDEYDSKMFMFARDPATLRPLENIEVMESLNDKAEPRHE